MITKITIMSHKKEILDEIKKLEEKKQETLKLVNDLIQRLIELKGAFNELNRLEKDAE